MVGRKLALLLLLLLILISACWCSEAGGTHWHLFLTVTPGPGPGVLGYPPAQLCCQRTPRAEGCQNGSRFSRELRGFPIISPLLHAALLLLQSRCSHGV